MVNRIKLVIEYNGAGFHGWQIQNNLRTVQGDLTHSLSNMFHHPVKVTAASRTDAGVHAIGQVAHFDTDRNIPVQNILMGLNSLTPRDITIVNAEQVGPDFHARYSARGKEYQYKCFLRTYASPFYRKFAWHVKRNINVHNIEQAAKFLEGEHDFSSFRSSSCSAVSPVRKIHSITCTVKSELLLVTISGTGFLQHMVRTIMGTLLDVGLGNIKPEDMKTILEARDRNKASKTAPPDGLYLLKVYY